MKTYLAIKNWRKFQTFSEKRPQWVKLHTALLYDHDFLSMSEQAQAQLLKLWCLAASMGHPLSCAPAIIKGKIAAKTLRLTELMAAGFVYETDNPKEGSLEAISTPGILYAIRVDQTRVKIGVSRNFKSRLHQHKSKYGADITVLRTVDVTDIHYAEVALLNSHPWSRISEVILLAADMESFLFQKMDEAAANTVAYSVALASHDQSRDETHVHAGARRDRDRGRGEKEQEQTTVPNAEGEDNLSGPPPLKLEKSA